MATPNVQIRSVKAADKAAVMAVEALATPNLRYVPHVFAEFTQDNRGEFFLAEQAGEVVACAKFTVLPDESAWLETLRVIPARQGQGIGKRLYAHYFQLAERTGVKTLRMYTGLRNRVSKGLAEHCGFFLEESFLGYVAPTPEVIEGGQEDFRPVQDLQQASELILPHTDSWHNFLVLNRTFFRWSPALLAHLVELGQVYASPYGDNVIIMGARFMPEQALHIGWFNGKAADCIGFARRHAARQEIPQISCFFPAGAAAIAATLDQQGFKANPAPYVVMRRDL